MADAIKPYLSESTSVTAISDIAEFADAPHVEASGIAVVYLIGHGWQADDRSYRTCLRSGTGSSELNGMQLVGLVGGLITDSTQLLLLVDTCEAEALADDLRLLPTKDHTTLFASSVGERAWNLKSDKGTLFAFALSEVLSTDKHGDRVQDPADFCQRIQSVIERDVSAPHQTATRRVAGRPILLTPSGAPSPAARRRRTFVRLMIVTVCTAASVTVAAAGLGTYWWSHAFVTVDMGDLQSVCSEPEFVVHIQSPESNTLREIKRTRVDGLVSAWFFLPADNLIISFVAKYEDGRERLIRFHHVFEPGFRTRKSRRFTLPPPSEIASSPGMAFVYAGSWLQGAERDPGPPVAPFWIDIQQVTIREYLPDVLRLRDEGAVESYQSVLLTDAMRHGGLAEDELPATAEQLLELLAGTGSLLSRPDCPAPMTEFEAALRWPRSEKRPPTRIEWELAARGVDGRRFPWGNLVDRDAVNAGQPQEEGWKNRRMLRPSSGFPRNRSPFGLADPVGNAGDWVRDADGFGFMGGELRLNAEDCTTYSYLRLPRSHAELTETGWRVGIRGVKPSQASDE